MCLLAKSLCYIRNECHIYTDYSTVKFTEVFCWIDPDVAVTVMVYAPAVVPGLTTPPPAPPLPAPPPQARIPPARLVKSVKTARRMHQRFCLDGAIKRRMQAKAAPPPESQRPRCCSGFSPLVAGAVVATVNVAVPAALPAMFIGLVEPKLNVGGSVAFGGFEPIAAVSVTLPVNPPCGLTVIVD